MTRALVIVLAAFTSAALPTCSKTPVAKSPSEQSSEPRRATGHVTVRVVDESGTELDGVSFETRRGPPEMAGMTNSPEHGSKRFDVPVGQAEFAVRATAPRREAAEALLDFRSGELEREVVLTLPVSAGLSGRLRVDLHGLIPPYTCAELFTPIGFYLRSAFVKESDTTLHFAFTPGRYELDVTPEPRGDFTPSETTPRWYVGPNEGCLERDVAIVANAETIVPIEFEIGGHFRLHVRVAREVAARVVGREEVSCLDAARPSDRLCVLRTEDGLLEMGSYDFNVTSGACWTAFEPSSVGPHHFQLKAAGFRPLEFEVTIAREKFTDVDGTLVPE